MEISLKTLIQMKPSTRRRQRRFSPAGVHHHNQLVPLGAVANCELDLTQGELAECRATVEAAAVGGRKQQ